MVMIKTTVDGVFSSEEVEPRLLLVHYLRTRLGRTGTVVRVDGCSSVPDVEAHGADRRLEPTYGVRFAASDLWGDAQPGVVVFVDLWESYLEEP